MNWFNNSRRAAHIALGLCIAGLLVVSMGTLQAKPKTTKEKEDAIPTPPGYMDKVVTIPFYDDEGKLQMGFKMETAYRVDIRYLQMTHLKIETFDEAGKPDLLINMPVSLFDIGASVVSSVDPVTIHRSDFEMTGTNMTFNTETRQGKFKGPARMVIFNSDEFAGSQRHDATVQAARGNVQ